MPFVLPATRSSASRTGRSMSRCTASMRYPVQHEIADWDSIPSRRINGGSRADAARSIPDARISTRLFPPVQTAPACPRTVILLTLNGISAERRIIFADFERRLVVRAVVPLVHCFEAIPDLNSDTLWRSPCNCSDRFRSGSGGSSDEEKASTSRSDRGLSLQGELFSISLRVRHIDFSDKKKWRFGLSMQPRNRSSSNHRTHDNSQSQSEILPHRFLPRSA